MPALILAAPLEYQVIQRGAGTTASIRLAGTFEGPDAARTSLETRLTVDGRSGPWEAADAAWRGAAFEATLEVPVGGWHRLAIRVPAGTGTFVETGVEHLGVGEIFVVAGQSNAANHGEEKQRPATGRVAAFDGRAWRLADDPQPGASGGGGSFLPPFGDAIVRRFDVPVGVVPCAIGATSVREWLPEGARFPSPPTIESRVRPRDDGGGWESRGEAFRMLTERMAALGPRGFRAVLWHQGESDANQADPSRTLPGSLYRQYLEQVIRASRRAIGWDAPWFVALASYHGPGDAGSPDIRDAQASLWRDGIALQGPDSDALGAAFRDSGGRGVHFSGPGLRAHAGRWAERVIPWLEREHAGNPRSEPPGSPGDPRPVRNGTRPRQRAPARRQASRSTAALRPPGCALDRRGLRCDGTGACPPPKSSHRMRPSRRVAFPGGCGRTCSASMLRRSRWRGSGSSPRART